MKSFFSAITLLLFSLTFSQTNSDLEFRTGAGNPSGNGPVQSTTITFQKNTDNPGGTTNVAYTPTLSAAFALPNQQYTFAPVPANGVSIGTAANGTSASASASAIFGLMNSNSSPINTNFTYAKGAAAGTGINVGTNRSVQFFTSTTGLFLNNEPLPTPGNDVRYYMSDLTINFNRPVTNPVLHIAGLGGAIGTNITFASELELSTAGLTLTRLSGSAEFSIPNTTQISNSAAAYSATTGAGAASGSVVVNGNNISSITFRVYLKAKDPNNALNPMWGTATSSSGDIFSIGISTLEDDLSISKTVDTSSPVIGGNVVFTILASNNGPSNDTNVVVNDLLPSGFTYVSSAPSAGTYNPLTGAWTIGSLAAGITQTLTVTATVNFTGNHTNTASIAGDNEDPDLANNATSVYSYPQPDSDKDGITDNCDLDDDNDGITDLVEEECASSGQILRIGYIPNSRDLDADNGYTFDGSLMSGSGALKLTNPANFGPGGIVNTTIQLVPITANPITKSSITALNLNTIFIGGIDDLSSTYLSAVELAAIKDWSDDSPNNLVVATQYSTTAWNSTIANSNLNPDQPTALGSTTTIFKGPFGTVTTFDQGGGFQGIFSNIDTSCGTKVLAVDSNNEPVIYTDGNYDDFLVGDVDIFTTLGGVTSGNAITSNNDKLFANIWANVAQRTLCSAKDTDGDGTPDRLDADSDNDGCPDAIEGSENVTVTQIYPLTDPLYPGQIKVKADGITIGLLPSQIVSTSISGSGIPELVNNAANNSSGNSGAADNTDGSADLGQGIGTSADATISVCFCYKPATLAGTVLDTKSGITALGRAGTDNGNWPMVRKGAWTALEAKTKGFVVNRIPTTAQVNAIATPVEGMMVYDEEADCLKIYTTTNNGTSFSWQCFNTQTCPDY